MCITNTTPSVNGSIRLTQVLLGPVDAGSTHLSQLPVCTQHALILSCAGLRSG